MSGESGQHSDGLDPFGESGLRRRRYSPVPAIFAPASEPDAPPKTRACPAVAPLRGNARGSSAGPTLRPSAGSAFEAAAPAPLPGPPRIDRMMRAWPLPGQQNRRLLPRADAPLRLPPSPPAPQPTSGALVTAAGVLGQQLQPLPAPAPAPPQDTLEDYKCPLCFDLLCRPCGLPCGFTVCESCLAKVLTYGRGKAVCPVLGRNCKHGSVRSLPNVHILLHNYLRARFPREYSARLEEEGDNRLIVQQVRHATQRPTPQDSWDNPPQDLQELLRRLRDELDLLQVRHRRRTEILGNRPVMIRLSGLRIVRSPLK
jgi:hypothetical protein